MVGMPPARRTRSVTAWIVAPLSQTSSTIRIRRPRRRVGRELEEGRLGTGRARVVVVGDGGHQDVPDPEAVGEHPGRDHPAAGDRQHRVAGDAANLLGERGDEPVEVVPRHDVAFQVDQPGPAGDGRDDVDGRVGPDRLVERGRPLAVDEHVDVLADRRAGIAQPVGDPRPARIERGDQLADGRGRDGRAVLDPGTRAASERGRMTAAIGVRRRSPRPTRSAAGSARWTSSARRHRRCRRAGRCSSRSRPRPDRARRGPSPRGGRRGRHPAGEPGVAADPAVAAVVRPPHGRLAIGHVAAAVVAVERDRPDRPRIAWVGDHREAELAGQTGGDLLPREAAVERAVLAAVVLLVEVLWLAGGHDQLVDALPGDRHRIRLKSARTPRVARLPGRPAVARLERAHGRDRHPHPIRVGRVGDDRVEDEPAGAGLPGRARGVVGQALDVGPGPPAVIAPEQAAGPTPA